MNMKNNFIIFSLLIMTIFNLLSCTDDDKNIQYFQHGRELHECQHGTGDQ